MFFRAFPQTYNISSSHHLGKAIYTTNNLCTTTTSSSTTTANIQPCFYTNFEERPLDCQAEVIVDPSSARLDAGAAENVGQKEDQGGD